MILPETVHTSHTSAVNTFATGPRIPLLHSNIRTQIGLGWSGLVFAVYMAGSRSTHSSTAENSHSHKRLSTREAMLTFRLNVVHIEGSALA
jgi:hypothetical protein